MNYFSFLTKQKFYVLICLIVCFLETNFLYAQYSKAIEKEVIKSLSENEKDTLNKRGQLFKNFDIKLENGQPYLNGSAKIDKVNRRKNRITFQDKLIIFGLENGEDSVKKCQINFDEEGRAKGERVTDIYGNVVSTSSVKEIEINDLQYFQLSIQTFYTNGILKEQMTKVSREKPLREIAPWKSFVFHGEMRRYDENGQIFKVENYEFGKKVKY